MINQPRDKYEQEADRMAESVMQPYPSSGGFEMISDLNFDRSDVVRLMPDSRSLPVPQWDQLPAYAQDDLSPKGYDKSWFDSHNDLMRLTVLNLYVKLNSKGLNLWRFVDHEVDSQVGAFQETFNLRLLSNL